MSTQSLPSVTYLNHRYGVASWLLTKDHKRIGIMYMVVVTLAFMLGGLFAAEIRAQQGTTGGQWTSYGGDTGSTRYAPLDQIDKENFFDFDIAIATPDMMGKVGRVGRKLGPRGLMPNPKSGTIVSPDDLPRTIREVRGGRVEFRNDKTGLLHVAVGKVSFSEQQIQDNIIALMEAVKAAKPSATKGVFVKSVTFTSTMGPGIRVDPIAAQALSSGGSSS